MCLTGKMTLNRPKTSYSRGAGADTAAEAVVGTVADGDVAAATVAEAAEGAAAAVAFGLGPA